MALFFHLCDYILFVTRKSIAIFQSPISLKEKTFFLIHWIDCFAIERRQEITIDRDGENARKRKERERETANMCRSHLHENCLRCKRKTWQYSLSMDTNTNYVFYFCSTSAIFSLYTQLLKWVCDRFPFYVHTAHSTKLTIDEKIFFLSFFFCCFCSLFLLSLFFLRTYNYALEGN